MSKEERKVPELRFKGFHDDWEQREIGEISCVLTGGTPRTNEQSFWNPKEIPWMSSGEINKKRLLETDDMISEKGLENSSARWVQKNSVLIALAGQGKTRGTVAINTLPLTTNQSIAAIQPSDILDSEYLYQNLDGRYHELRIKSSGDGTRGGLNKKIISELSIDIPKLYEQVQIGKFLKSLDIIITLHQRSINTLNQLKQSLIKAIIPVNSHIIPRINFYNFNRDPQFYFLKDILTERRDLALESIEYPLMSFVQGKGVTPKNDRYDRSFLVKENNKKYKKTVLGDFIYSSNNLETGSIGLNTTGNAVISPVYSIFYSRNIIESKYIGFMSNNKSFINEMIRYRQGVVYGQWRIHEKDFLNINVLIPTISEQTKVVCLLENIDSQILLKQKKLENLLKLKTMYLKKMII